MSGWRIIVIWPGCGLVTVHQAPPSFEGLKNQNALLGMYAARIKACRELGRSNNDMRLAGDSPKEPSETNVL